MDAQKQQAIERLQTANNILVTVSRDPSVDQLSAAIGITVLLNKLGKHATAVYSGKTPSTIEFLQPEKTIEKNTDSLRDFIIALDKSKADKLRYKVEDQMVKIFITPYRTSISDKDLEYSQGDFNVEVVLALGVVRQQDLDQAITAHGRILHDATVIGVTTQAGEEALGSINWVDTAASSLSEMMTHLGLALDNNILDEQTATALLTGIVAETERFSNQKTTSETMQASAKLMEAGANQQLVASELAAPAKQSPPASDDTSTEGDATSHGEGGTAQADGSLVIEHEPGELPPEQPAADEIQLPEPEDAPEVEQINIDYDGQIKTDSPQDAPQNASVEPPKGDDQSGDASLKGSSRLVLQPPTLGGQLTANSKPEELDPAIDPMAPALPRPLLRHDASSSVDATNAASDQHTAPPSADTPSTQDAPDNKVTPEPNDTLTDLEKLVSSPHISPINKPADEPTPAEPEPPKSPDPLMPPSVEKPASSEPQVDNQPPQFENPAAPPAPIEPPTNVHSARDAVDQAVNSADAPSRPLEPVQSLNAMPVDLDLGDIPAVNTSPASAFADPSANVPPEPAHEDSDNTTTSSDSTSQGQDMVQEMHVASDPDLPPGLITNEPVDVTAAPNPNATSSPTVAPQGLPPQVPPPMMPPNFGSPQSNGAPQPASPPTP